LGHRCIFELLIEDHFGVRVSPIGKGGIVLAAVKAVALRVACGQPDSGCGRCCWAVIGGSPRWPA